MKARCLGFLCAGLLLTGCPPAAEHKGAIAPLSESALPSEPAKLIGIADEQFDKGGQGVENSVLALQRALKDAAWAQTKDAYDAYWRLARAYAELSDGDNAAKKAQMSDAGVKAGRRALELAPERVEGSYYLAQNIGYHAQSNKGENKELIAEMISQSERARQIDEKFDHGGPSRVLGAIYAKAPAPPLSVGDPEKAVKEMQRAVSLDGDFPANHLYLAEALIADERYPEADAELKKARAMSQDARWARYQGIWGGELTKIQRKLRAKQN